MTSEVDKEMVEPRSAVQPHDPPGQLGSNFDRLLISDEIEEPWFKSIGRSVRDLIHPPKLPPLEITSRPLESAGLGDMGRIEQPWFKSLASNIRDLVHPPKLPPLEVTSKPVEVGNIWGAYQGGGKRSGTMSILIHAGVITLLLVIFKGPDLTKKAREIVPLYFPLNAYQPKLPPAAQKSGGGGGGGQKMPTPVSHGAPPKPSPKPFMPPAMAVPKPVLPVTPQINAMAPPVIADNYGDPNALSKLLSGGQGANGLGSGTGGGLGSGSGNGYGPGSGGGQGGGVYQIGGDVSQPVRIFGPEPEYSEEARKAKYSGTVLLSLVIDEHGNTRDIKVVRPLGLGLDEKAIEAVAKWRFRPAMKGGRAVAVSAQVEVNFRLL